MSVDNLMFFGFIVFGFSVVAAYSVWLVLKIKYQNAVIIDGDPSLYHAVKGIVEGTESEKDRFIDHVTSQVYKD